MKTFEDLARDWAEGDIAAGEGLLQVLDLRFGEPIRYRLRKGMDADDATSETYLMLWEMIHEWDPARSPLDAYVAVTWANRVNDVFRRICVDYSTVELEEYHEMGAVRSAEQVVFDEHTSADARDTLDLLATTADVASMDLQAALVWASTEVWRAGGGAREYVSPGGAAADTYYELGVALTPKQAAARCKATVNRLRAAATAAA